MNKIDLFKVMDLIDDDLVREAELPQDNAETAENSGNTVSGVEAFHVPAWRRLTSLAAALVLAFGVGAGGLYLMKHRPPMQPEETDATPTAEFRAEDVYVGSPEITTDTAAKESTDIHSDTDSAAGTAEASAAEITETSSEDSTDIVTAETDTQVVELPVENTEGGLPAVELPHYAEVTTPEGVPVPITTTTEADPNDTPYVPEDSQYIFDRLASLTYCPETCDGLPEYTLYAPDGTIYYICFTGGWVWRNGTEEAVLPADVALAIQTQMNQLIGGPTQWNNDPISPAPNS